MKPPSKKSSTLQSDPVEQAANAIESLTRVQFCDVYQKLSEGDINNLRRSLRESIGRGAPISGMNGVVTASEQIFYFLRSVGLTPQDSSDVNNNAFLFTGRIQGILIQAFGALKLDVGTVSPHFGAELRVPDPKDSQFEKGKGLPE